MTLDNELKNKTEILAGMKEALENAQEHKFKEYFKMEENGKVKIIKNMDEFKVLGCYIIYNKNRGLFPAVYVGSTNKEGRTVENRLYDIFHKNHTLSTKLTKLYGTREAAINFLLYTCYFRCIPQKHLPRLLMESGLIFLLNPQYNKETSQRKE